MEKFPQVNDSNESNDRAAFEKVQSDLDAVTAENDKNIAEEKDGGMGTFMEQMRLEKEKKAMMDKSEDEARNMNEEKQ